jgi:hypothetical protein
LAVRKETKNSGETRGRARQLRYSRDNRAAYIQGEEEDKNRYVISTAFVYVNSWGTNGNRCEHGATAAEELRKSRLSKHTLA